MPFKVNCSYFGKEEGPKTKVCLGPGFVYTVPLLTSLLILSSPSSSFVVYFRSQGSLVDWTPPDVKSWCHFSYLGDYRMLIAAWLFGVEISATTTQTEFLFIRNSRIYYTFIFCIRKKIYCMCMNMLVNCRL